MIEVFIWMPNRLVDEKSYFGHTALHVNKRTYISWFPQRYRGWKMAFINSSPHRFRSFEDESLMKQPDYNIVLHGLDEEAILDWWQGFGLNRGISEKELEIFEGPLPRYHLLKQSCSSVVATALQIGARNDRSLRIRQPFWGVWTPKRVLDLAISIQERGGPFGA